MRFLLVLLLMYVSLSIPSLRSLWQALIACATRLHEVKTSAEFGVGISGEVSVDFGKVMNRMRRVRSTISEVRPA